MRNFITRRPSGINPVSSGINPVSSGIMRGKSECRIGIGITLAGLYHTHRPGCAKRNPWRGASTTRRAGELVRVAGRWECVRRREWGHVRPGGVPRSAGEVRGCESSQKGRFVFATGNFVRTNKCIACSVPIGSDSPFPMCDSCDSAVHQRSYVAMIGNCLTPIEEIESATGSEGANDLRQKLQSGWRVFA